MCIESIDVKEISTWDNGFFASYSVETKNYTINGHISVEIVDETEVYINGFLMGENCTMPFFFVFNVNKDANYVGIKIWTDIGVFVPDDIVDKFPKKNSITIIEILQTVLCFVEEKSRELCDVTSTR